MTALTFDNISEYATLQKKLSKFRTEELLPTINAYLHDIAGVDNSPFIPASDVKDFSGSIAAITATAVFPGFDLVVSVPTAYIQDRDTFLAAARDDLENLLSEPSWVDVA